MYYSDNYFESKKIALSNGNSLIKTDNYIFCAKASKNDQITIYVSTL